jgi:hypothetical protein
MNVFTTEHPLASQASCFDPWRHPVFSYWCSLLVAALALLPLVLWLGLYALANDDAPSTDDHTTLTDLLMGTAVSFGFCLLCAFVIVSVHRLLTWRWGKKRLCVREGQ